MSTNEPLGFSLLTVKEAAEELRVSETSLRRLLASGELKAFKYGRTWRIPRENIIEYLTTNTVIRQVKGE